MVLACQTASQLLGIDCQSGMPRHAAKPIASAPSTTPAAAVRAGQSRSPRRRGGPGRASPRQQNAAPDQQADTPARTAAAVQRVPPDPEGAERHDGQADDAVGQHRTDRDGQRPPQAAGAGDDGTGHGQQQ